MHVMSEKKPSASEIRQYKKSLRDNLKNKMTLSIKRENPEKEVNLKASVRRKRKASSCFKEFDNMSVLKDVTLKGRFEDLFQLKKKLGEGAHSTVWSCQEIKTGKIYAVKITRRRDLELMENRRECFQIMRELHHTSIIQVNYLFMNEKILTCHLVEQLCPYPQLSTYIRQSLQMKGKVQEKPAATIIQAILNCINFIHEKGACHRDIKPDNILYDPQTGKIKLIDFQLARMQRYTHEKLWLWSPTGTKQYMAPEMFNGIYNEIVDIWATGIIAFEMLVGKLPFKSSFEKNLIDEIRQRQIIYEKLDISLEAKNFLKGMLQKSPKKRMTAQQALSSPFILKHTTKSGFKLKKQITSMMVKEQAPSEKTNFYDEDAKFSFRNTRGQNIGVIICEEDD